MILKLKALLNLLLPSIIMGAVFSVILVLMSFFVSIFCSCEAGAKFLRYMALFLLLFVPFMELVRIILYAIAYKFKR